MRIAFFGHDLFALLLDQLDDAGHEICQLFSPPTDAWNQNQQINRFAERRKIPVQIGRPALSDIQDCASRGIELLLVAAYPYRIPGTDLIRGINLHPTRLPFGRGPSPVPWLIMRYPDQAALTLHKLTAVFDAGDILAQESIPVDPSDDMETLCGKLQRCAPRLVLHTIANLDHAWATAIAQEQTGSYWPLPAASDQTLDHNLTVAENLRIVRAFGNFGARAMFDERAWAVVSASGWEESHTLPLGSVVSRLGECVVLAVKDGFLALRQCRAEPGKGEG
jgi:methionyl-tRNA formyltransferase